MDKHTILALTLDPAAAQRHRARRRNARSGQQAGGGTGPRPGREIAACAGDGATQH